MVSGDGMVSPAEIVKSRDKDKNRISRPRNPT